MSRIRVFYKSCGLLIALLCIVLSASAAKKPEMTRIYMFGFAASFVDSVAYQTDIQQIDSAWIEPVHKFLVDRSLYSLQLQYYLESAEGRKNTICTVFFDKNPRKLQKRWSKVNRRYNKVDDIRLMSLPAERFKFKAEEWKQITIEETPATSSSTAAPAKDTKEKKKKKENS